MQELESNEPRAPSRTPRDTRWLRCAGLAAFVLALSLYRSHENRPVLGLWSYPFTAVLVCAGAALAIVVWRSMRRGVERPSSPALQLFDGSLFVWGVAYAIAALEDRVAAARILDVNVLGSIAPIPALAEWVALGLGLAAAITALAPRLGETGRNLLLVLGSVGLVLYVGEGFIRARAAADPRIQGFPTHTSRQWVRRFVEVNSLGFRDREHAAVAPIDQRRLLVVGDSFAFGAGIDRIEDRFGERVAKGLSEELDEPWHSMNAAKRDSHTLDELRYLEETAHLERDAVLLVYVFNDIDYLSPVTPRGGPAGHQSGLRAKLRPVRVLFLNSYLFQEIYIRARMMSYSLDAPAEPLQGPYADPEIMRQHLDDLERLVAQASRDGVPAWIVPFDIEARDGGRYLERYERFVAAATRRGLPILALDGVFDDHGAHSLIVNELDWHPNELAHGLAGAHVARAIAPRLRERRRDPSESATRPPRP